MFFQSVRNILSLPDRMRLFMCHDSPPAGREPECETTVRDQRNNNIRVNDAVGEELFVTMRTARDKTFDMLC
jgi:hypothetical protein